MFKLLDKCRYIHVKLCITKISKRNCILTGLSNTYKTQKRKIERTHVKRVSCSKQVMKATDTESHRLLHANTM